MAGPRIGVRKQRPTLRGTADGAVGQLLGVPKGAGASQESPESWEELHGSSLYIPFVQIL
jgi:hypothetical protein